MHLYFFHNSRSEISANNFVRKDLSEETLKDFLKSIRMLDHPYYRSHNLEKIEENSYHLNVEMDQWGETKSFVMAIIDKKPVKLEEMELHDEIQSILKKRDSKEIVDCLRLLSRKITEKIREKLPEFPEDHDHFDKFFQTLSRYRFYDRYILDLEKHYALKNYKDKRLKQFKYQKID